MPNSQIEEQNENIKDLIISKDVENIEINEDLNTLVLYKSLLLKKYKRLMLTSGISLLNFKIKNDTKKIN